MRLDLRDQAIEIAVRDTDCALVGFRPRQPELNPPTALVIHDAEDFEPARLAASVDHLPLKLCVQIVRISVGSRRWLMMHHGSLAADCVLLVRRTRSKSISADAACRRGPMRAASSP